MNAFRLRPVLALALLVFAAAFAAGCGGDDNNTNAENTSATTATGDAMKNEEAAMKKDDAAMKKDDAAMKKDDAAMKADAAMKKDDAKMAASGRVVQVGSTSYGKILQDSRGRTLYLFTKEKGKKSRCYGDCAKAWPPLLTKGEPRARKGAKQSLLGTTKRKGGTTQVTYNGHPLYFYVDEDEPNEVLCQAVPEFGGIWYVVNKNGKAITKR